MKRLVAVFALTLSGFSAFSDEPDLVGGARRAAAYWNSRYGRCSGNAAQGGAWYGVVADEPGCTNCAKPGSIQMVPDFRIRFRTEELSQEERLNGFEFKATTGLEPGPFRWWIAQNKAWRDWQVGEIAPPVILTQKHGVWSTKAAEGMVEPNLKALGNCSQIPPAKEEKQ
jgi:hypothetical protein